MPYFKDSYADIGRDELVLTPEPIAGYIVNKFDKNKFTYLIMSTGLIYVREIDINLKPHVGWVYLHESCINEIFPNDRPYVLFDIECVNLINHYRDGLSINSMNFQKFYQQLFNKYGVQKLHEDFFDNFNILSF
jgi:hypothetical protein